MEKNKFFLHSQALGEILSREEMKDILMDTGSGSGSGSGSTPQSYCQADCTCPDGVRSFTVFVVCKHDCQAVDQQGAECLVNGQPADAATCSDGFGENCAIDPIGSGSGSII